MSTRHLTADGLCGATDITEHLTSMDSYCPPVFVMAQNNSPIYMFKMTSGGGAGKPRVVSERVGGTVGDRESPRVMAEVGNPGRHQLLFSKGKGMGTS